LDEPSGELLAYHGFLPMGSDLGSVLGRVYEFLESEEGEGETIIISFKQVKLYSLFYSKGAPSLSGWWFIGRTGEYFKPFIREYFAWALERTKRCLVL